MAITLAPGYFLRKLAGEIKEKEHRKALRSLAAALLSIAAVAVIAAVTLMGSKEREKDNSSDRVREYRATSVRVEGKSATMYQHKDYLVTNISGPVGSAGIPEVIQLGDVITVEGNTIQVQYIIVKEFLTDMKYGNEILGKKGDIHCTIVQSLENLPYVDEEKSRNRLWINIQNCVPLKMAFWLNFIPST
ncbi:MAG: hypothetical protein U0319_03385 [Nitrospira sp.]